MNFNKKCYEMKTFEDFCKRLDEDLLDQHALDDYFVRDNTFRLRGTEPGKYKCYIVAADGKWCRKFPLFTYKKAQDVALNAAAEASKVEIFGATIVVDKEGWWRIEDPYFVEDIEK